MTLFLITGMSGAGKTTIANTIQQYGEWIEIISYTTRPKRIGEVDGNTYYFINQEEFEKMKSNGEFIETTEYDSNFYGISRYEIEEKLSDYKRAFIIVDNNGYNQIKKLYPDAIGIFLYMTKEECLANMLLRGDSMDNALRRISTYDDELATSVEYDYVIKNVRDKVNSTINVVRNIINQYK